MILVAGGQGTRLGFDHPRECFASAQFRTALCLRCTSLAARRDEKYGIEIPLFVMTSPATDEETKRYFETHDRLGLPEHLLQIFCQGTMPAIDQATGRYCWSPKAESR